MRMFIVFFGLMISGVLLAGEKVRVAEVEVSEIGDLLERLALESAELKDLKVKFLESKALKEELAEKMQKDLLSGKKLDPMSMAAGMMEDSGLQTKVSEVEERILVRVLEEMFGKRYDLILKKGYGEGALFSNIAVENVTMLVKQHLLKMVDKLGAGE